jgi:hypothetical protein
MQVVDAVALHNVYLQKEIPFFTRKLSPKEKVHISFLVKFYSCAVTAHEKRRIYLTCHLL